MKNKNTIINLVILVSFFAITFGLFFNNLNDPFVSDDWNFLLTASSENFNFSEVFITNHDNKIGIGTYRPMVKIFWKVMYTLGGFNPVPYHLVSVFFHVGNAFLLFLLTKFLFSKWKLQFSKHLSFLGAFLFLILPNHSSSVIWISVINDTMMTFFFLLALYLFCLYLFKNKIVFYIFSILSFFIAMFTKEMALAFPLVAAVSFFILQDSEWKKKIWRFIFLLLPFLLIIIIYFLLRSQATGSILDIYGRAPGFNLHVMYKSFVSIFLSNFLSGQVLSTSTLFFIEYKIVVLFLSPLLFSTLIWLSWKNKDMCRIVSLFILYIFSWFGASQLSIVVSQHYFSSEGERLAYLPSVFFALLIGCTIGILFLSLRKKNVLFIPLVVCIFLSIILLTNQLVIKNKRWDKVSNESERILNESISIVSRENIDGVVMVGLPDSQHGSFLWRNGFREAAKLLGSETDFLTTDIHSILSKGVVFNVSKIDYNEYDYSVENGYFFSPPIINTQDYKAQFLDTKRYEGGALSNKIIFNLSEGFIQGPDTGRKIELWFYTPQGFVRFDPKNS